MAASCGLAEGKYCSMPKWDATPRCEFASLADDGKIRFFGVVPQPRIVTRFPVAEGAHDHPVAVEPCLNCAGVSACSNISSLTQAEKLSKGFGRV
jgi:hypothetical protein